MDLNTDFSYMTDEELDELISRIKRQRNGAQKAERLTFGIMSGER